MHHDTQRAGNQRKVYREVPLHIFVEDESGIV